MSWFDSLVPGVKRRRKRDKEKRAVPEGVWLKCTSCGNAIFENDFASSLGVCGKCGHHHHLEPLQRAQSLLDPGKEIKEIASNLRPRDFLKFVDKQSYKDRLVRHGKNDPSKEALRCYSGMLDGRPVVLACFDWSFMGGSMGSVVGERFARGIDSACEQGAAFVCFSSSGGARMQEGLTSLMQMAKTTAAQAKLAEYGLPFFSVLCNPTTGGVAASFALVADVVIAEPGATIGFAGERVIRSTVREKLPEGFQRSEFLLKHGSVDMVVERTALRDTLAGVVGILQDGRSNARE